MTTTCISIFASKPSLVSPGTFGRKNSGGFGDGFSNHNVRGLLEVIVPGGLITIDISKNVILTLPCGLQERMLEAARAGVRAHLVHLKEKSKAKLDVELAVLKPRESEQARPDLRNEPTMEVVSAAVESTEHKVDTSADSCWTGEGSNEEGDEEEEEEEV